jgi:RNA polymerase sigma-70 factor (ECF subfamily)
MIETSKYHLTETELTKEQSKIEAAKKNPALFADLYDNYFEPIFRFVFQRLDDKEQAFDTTQQVFLVAMNNLSKYQYRGVPFSSWLFRIASNEITDLFRKEKARRTVNIDSLSMQHIMEEIQETKIDMYHDKIVTIIGEQLDENELKLIEMRFFENRSFKEIGEILEITENNAKVRTYRVLDKLRKVI